jgi:hypothetical protein
MINADSPSDIVGKKVFFLYPTAVVQNKVIAELVQQEYEVYIAKNHDALRRVLRKYPDSIVFVDIDEVLPEKEWESWITTVMKTPETKNAAIGIVTAKDDEALKQKYQHTLGISCGYVAIGSDLDKATVQLMEALHKVDAKGRRKYIRVTTEKEGSAAINLPLNDAFINGVIKDISVVGISCTFYDDPDLAKNTLFKDIQVKLQSNLLKVEGIVFGSRMDGSAKIYVILFTQRIDPDVRIRIRKFIQQSLQARMDMELK